MRTRVVEFGPLPVLAPNFSSARGFAISSDVTLSIPTKEPYKLDAKLRAYPTFMSSYRNSQSTQEDKA